MNESFECLISLEHKFKFLCDIPVRVSGESYHGSNHDDDPSSFDLETVIISETLMLFDAEGNETETVLFFKGADITEFIDEQVKEDIREKFFSDNVEMTREPSSSAREAYRRGYR